MGHSVAELTLPAGLLPDAIATVSRCVEAIATSMRPAEVIDLTRLSRRQQVA
jgi:hypothetical protein